MTTITIRQPVLATPEEQRGRGEGLKRFFGSIATYLAAPARLEVTSRDAEAILGVREKAIVAAYLVGALPY